MKTYFKINKFAAILSVLAVFFGILPASTAAASSTGVSLAEFSAVMSSSNASKLTGVFVEDVMALRVVKQSSPSHVSYIKNSVTQFNQAGQYGSIGLLAHNYLSGGHFFDLEIGTTIHLVYGDGSSKAFMVTEIEQFQALSPDDPYSNFINLDEPNTIVSSSHVINEMYGKNGSLVLQTCITKDGNITWGRHFVIAAPVDEEKSLATK